MGFQALQDAKDIVFFYNVLFFTFRLADVQNMKDK